MKKSFRIDDCVVIQSRTGGEPIQGIVREIHATPHEVQYRVQIEAGTKHGFLYRLEHEMELV